MNVTLPLLAALLQLPSQADTSRQRDRCAIEATVERLAARCTQLLAGPPPSGNTLAMWGESALAVDEQPQPIDVVALDAILGPRARETSWTVWPKALKGGASACVIRALGQPGGFASHIRFDRTPLGTPAIEGARPAACPSLESRRMFDSMCRALHDTGNQWAPATVQKAAFRGGLGGNGVSRDLSGSDITAAQVAIAFGPPSTTRADKSVHLRPPWFDQDGRRCSAEARFVDGRLTRLRLWRTPQRPPPATPSSVTPLVQRIELLCEAMHAQERAQVETLARGLGAQRFDHPDVLNLRGLWPLRMLDLVDRLGAPAFVPRYGWFLPDVWRRAGDQVYYLRDRDGAPKCALRVAAPDGIPTLHAPELAAW